ncbi:sensor histidine kinase [Psychrobacter sp. I-STPA10]|uniref:sensor histidine kinase n=1 Tax=Psychrobacter sp. I-STPA10 TaxID=2585769 RepID=UPI001E561664|nr:sensor histidine kinase [Psychrobacter sp. I-STPA10]
MHRLGLHSVFSKLFASVMLTLILFAIAMVMLTQLVHDNSANTRWQVLANQILTQVDPFLDELNIATNQQNRLKARFMMAVVKKSFDIFDESLQAKMGLYDAEGHLLVQTDNSDLPKELPEEPSWIAQILPVLTDADTPANNQVRAYSQTGYILLYESRHPLKRSKFAAVLNLFTGTLLLLIIMTLVLWWIARSMTWRINQMSQQMNQLGDGDFSVRVPVKGTDEIASLAKGFNQAAQKIEQLISANNLLLAHASHELRTPITRIRLQVEMMDMLAQQLPETTKTKFDKRAQAINRDLTGLNDLVESILLVSRLDAGHALEQVEKLDLFDLVKQETQHYSEATLFGEHVVMLGQPKLLIHLIRNLLNNAMIHGTPPIEVHVYGAMSLSDALTAPEHIYEQPIIDITPPQDSHTSRSISDEQPEITTLPIPLTTPTAATEAEHVTNNVNSAKNAEYETVTQYDTNDCDTVMTPNKLAVLSPNNTNDNLPLDLSQFSFVAIDITKFKEQAGVILDIHQIADLALQEIEHEVAQQAKQSEKAPQSQTSLSTFSTEPTTQDKSTKTDKPNRGNLLPDNPFAKRSKKSKTQTPVYAVLAVIDQGSGIPEDKRQDIFSPFVRLQQQKKGSGLGLSLVSQIIEAHQGKILTDTVDGHTRFLAILPTTTSHDANNK